MKFCNPLATFIRLTYQTYCKLLTKYQDTDLVSLSYILYTKPFSCVFFRHERKSDRVLTHFIDPSPTYATDWNRLNNFERDHQLIFSLNLVKCFRRSSSKVVDRWQTMEKEQSHK